MADGHGGAARGGRAVGGAAHHPLPARPIVVAANRLPVTRAPGGWTPSPGGLVRALLPLLRATGGTWVGWTGEADDVPEPFTQDGVQLHPVLVTADEVQDYYEGFSNDTLWPLYHDALRDSTYDARHWEAYQAVNQRFADALAEIAPDGAIVWIHDYHLQLVPDLLRAKRPDVIIGFFFHIPFPPVELFMRLPWRTEIATGLAGCRPRRLPTGDQRRQLHRHLRRAARAQRPGRVVSRSRSTSTSWRPSPPAGRRGSAPTATAHGSASRRSCCSASTASTTPRASASACGRIRRCSRTARWTPSGA